MIPAHVAPLRTAYFLPSRGGKPSAVFGLKASWGDVGTRPQDNVADFTHTGQESPCWAGGPGKAALLAAHLPGRLKSYFPLSIHT